MAPKEEGYGGQTQVEKKAEDEAGQEKVHGGYSQVDAAV